MHGTIPFITHVKRFHDMPWEWSQSCSMIPAGLQAGEVARGAAMGWVGRRLLVAVRQPHCCTTSGPIVPLGTGPSALRPAPSAPMQVLQALLSPRPSLLPLRTVCNQPRLMLDTPLGLLPGKVAVSGSALMLSDGRSLGHALTGRGRG